MGERAVVHVALLGEGTEVCRPVAAEPAGLGLFRLLGPVPDDETWEFQPGAVVRCESRVLSGGAVCLAVARVVATPGGAERR
jgi:hypothetical protein